MSINDCCKSQEEGIGNKGFVDLYKTVRTVELRSMTRTRGIETCLALSVILSELTMM